MTTNPNVDSQEQNGADGLPSKSVSSEQGGSIKDASELSQLLRAEIAEALKPVLSEVRGVQGRQDKDRTAMREFMDEFNKGKAKGLSDDAAEAAATRSISERKEAESDKLLIRQIAEKLGLSSAGNGTTTTANVVEVLKQFPDLDANDPDVIANVLSQQDPDKAELEASRLIRKRASQPSASAASPVAGTPPSPANLMDEFNQKAKSVRGMDLIDLKMQYRKKGLDIN